MISNKELIVIAALRMFGQDGFKSTSTARIAREVGVSEALIFRHFGNKQGLLDAVLEKGMSKVDDLLEEIVSEKKPKEVIKLFLELPSKIEKEDYDFWRLQFALKWELKVDTSEHLGPVKKAVLNAFTKLEYEHPELETQHIFHHLDGISMALIRGQISSPDELTRFLKGKYGLKT